MSSIFAVLFVALFFAVPAGIFLRPRFLCGAGTFVVLFLAGLGFACFTQVSQSTIGVVTTFGDVQPDTLGEGAHFVNPVSQVHEVFLGLDVARIEKAQAASKDLQSVHTDLTMNYHVDPKQAIALYRLSPTLQYENLYIQPAMFEVFKSVAARYTAEELVTQRAKVSDDIHAALVTKLRSYGFLIQDINITNFSFSKSFDEAIEAKVTASQKAEQAQRDLQRVQFEVQQRIAKAEGEAKAIAIQSEAVNKNGGAYLQLQAIQRWDGKLPTYMGANAPLPFIDASK